MSDLATIRQSTTEPMPDSTLVEFETLAGKLRVMPGSFPGSPPQWYAHDVPRLVTEIRRLRAELDVAVKEVLQLRQRCGYDK